MKYYSKQYEDVLASVRRLKKCNLDYISTDRESISLEIYKTMFGKLLADMQRDVFDYLVKAIWLSRRFVYNGRPHTQLGRNGHKMDEAFSIFMQHYVGRNFHLISRNRIYHEVITYFDDFFPDFDISNPFENKYEYPFKHMWFEHLIVVHRMDERMDLLHEGEKQKMTFEGFGDYVINYISCLNAEQERPKYVFGFINHLPWYVRKIPYEYRTNDKTKAGDFYRREVRFPSRGRFSTTPVAEMLNSNVGSQET